MCLPSTQIMTTSIPDENQSLLTTMSTNESSEITEITSTRDKDTKGKKNYFFILKLILSFLVLLFIIAIILTHIHLITKKKCNPVKENILNVHIISHTHLDTGWVLTYDQYYDFSVKSILDSVIESLTSKEGLKTRKFSFVEISFFSRYWNEINETKRDVLRKLVEDNKLQFVSGGWVMNDEATTHYSMIIDQMSLGHHWLNQTFGPKYLPTTGWQIDPFGHSREYASILSQMGFNGLFLGRIDYQGKKLRELYRNQEFIWKTDPNLKSNNYLFTGITPTGYYPIEGYCVDCGFQAVDEYNYEEMSRRFLDIVKSQSRAYSTNHLMATMGGDFHYKNAEHWFRSLDVLIESVNRFQNGTHLLYSTPDCYLKSLQNTNKIWTDMKTDDFFPYADKRNAYWSGYFTSRPTLKYYINYANSILQIAKQLIVIADVYPIASPYIKSLQESVALTQHHDAITGTSKQYVAEDYMRMLENGIIGAQTVIANAYQKLFNTRNWPQFCHHLNISQCVYTENISVDGLLEICIYNPIAYQLSHYISLPITRPDFQIIDSNGKVIESVIIPIRRHIRSLTERNTSAEYEIHFETLLHPLSFSKYYIQNIMRPVIPKIIENVSSDMREIFFISNNKLVVVIDKRNGLLKNIVIDGQSLNITQNFHYYTLLSINPSGAYVMRTNNTSMLISDEASVTVIRNNLFEQVIQEFNPWLSQVIRVYRNRDYIEFDWIVGPLPTDQDYEVITRFDTNLKTEGTFFTDSNGRQTLRRKRNFRETWNLETEDIVSSNYYPITSWISIKDLDRNLEMTVMPDRSQGGSSLRDGSIELMIHRRLTQDDGYGVMEPLNERGFDGRGLVVRGKHFLLLSKIDESMKTVKKLSKQLYWKPLPMFTTVSKPSFEKSPLNLINDIDDSIHLLNLEELNYNNILLRLEYILETNETNSVTKNISLNKLFANFEIINAIETSLTGIETISEVNRRKFIWNCDECDQRVDTNPVNNEDYFITTLHPNEIRTFLCKIERKEK